MWLLSKLKEYLSLEHGVQFYKTYIQPHTDYCSTVWGGTPHSNLDRIYRLQKRAVKIILDYEYNNDIVCSMDELKILNIYERVFPSRKLLCIKVTPDLHLTYSKNGGNMGLVLKMKNIACISILLTKHVKYIYLY